MEYNRISRKILEDKDSPKDSRKYSHLRSLLHGFYRRMIQEDLSRLIEKKFHLSFFSSSVLAVRPPSRAHA